MSDFNLPSSLRRHFLNLSLTIQQLVSEIVLTVEGMPSSDNRADKSKLEQAARARRANELIADKLKDFLSCHQLSHDDSAIALGAVNGNNVREIADFLGMNVLYVRRRLAQVKRLADKWQPSEVEDTHGGAEVLELFAEAQRR